MRALASRRAALAALALVPGAACSAYDDAEVFRSATTVADTSQGPTTDLPSATDSQADTTTTIEPSTSETETSETVTSETVTSVAQPAGREPTVTETTIPETTAAQTTTTPAPIQAASFANGAELAVSFNFSPTAGGRRIENPFIAVWVEDSAGDLVRTISLWYEQSEEGPKWLSHLSRWTSTTNSAVDTTTSGATRVPGDYTVVWDGTGDDGAIIPDGEYTLFVESARRGGAYDLTSTPITIGAGVFATPLPDSGELTAVSTELIA